MKAKTPPRRIAHHFKLSPVAAGFLRELAERLGMTNTAVVERLIREEAGRRRIKPEKDK